MSFVKFRPKLGAPDGDLYCAHQFLMLYALPIDVRLSAHGNPGSLCGHDFVRELARTVARNPVVSHAEVLRLRCFVFGVSALDWEAEQAARLLSGFVMRKIQEVWSAVLTPSHPDFVRNNTPASTSAAF